MDLLPSSCSEESGNSPGLLEFSKQSNQASLELGLSQRKVQAFSTLKDFWSVILKVLWPVNEEPRIVVWSSLQLMLIRLFLFIYINYFLFTIITFFFLLKGGSMITLANIYRLVREYYFWIYAIFPSFCFWIIYSVVGIGEINWEGFCRSCQLSDEKRTDKKGTCFKS